MWALLKTTDVGFVLLHYLIQKPLLPVLCRIQFRYTFSIVRLKNHTLQDSIQNDLKWLTVLLIPHLDFSAPSLSQYKLR